MAVSATHANTLYNYAVLLDSHLKRKTEAEVLYRKCLETQPRHAFALYNLAVLREEMVNNIIHKSAVSKHALLVLEANEKETKEGGASSSPDPNQLEANIEKEGHVANVISDEKEQELLLEVSKLYERAVEADSTDYTALADCGRYSYDLVQYVMSLVTRRYNFNAIA